MGVLLVQLFQQRSFDDVGQVDDVWAKVKIAPNRTNLFISVELEVGNDTIGIGGVPGCKRNIFACLLHQGLGYLIERAVVIATLSGIVDDDRRYGQNHRLGHCARSEEHTSELQSLM